MPVLRKIRLSDLRKKLGIFFFSQFYLISEFFSAKTISTIFLLHKKRKFTKRNFRTFNNGFVLNVYNTESKRRLNVSRKAAEEVANTLFLYIPPQTIIIVISTVESTSRAKGKFSLTFPFPHKHSLALLELSLLRGRHIVSRCERADEEENRHRHFAVIIVIHSVSVLSVLLLYVHTVKVESTCWF